MIAIKKGFIYLTLITIVAYVVVGCTKGSLEEQWQESIPTKVVEINITLPNNSPLHSDDVILTLLGERHYARGDGLFEVEVPLYKVFDASVMLPARQGEDAPTVFLSSMIVPGEIHIDLNSSETAAALLIEGVDQRFFKESAVSLFAKATVREEGKAFIDYFITEIERDPYLMRSDNLKDFLLANTLYTDNLTRINAILFNTFDVNRTMPATSLASPAPARSSALNAPALATEASTTVQNNSVKITPDEPQYGFFARVIYAEEGHYTGDLTLWNYSSLPSLYRLIDTTTHEVIKELPSGTLATAFSKDIFAPYGCPFNIQLPNHTEVKSGANNVKMELYTPGFKNFSEEVYFEEGSPSKALLLRSAYSYAFIPILGVVLPAEKFTTKVFDFLQKAGVFEDLVHYWSSGDVLGGLSQLFGNFKGLPKALLTKLIEGMVENPEVVVEIIGKKLITSEVSLASAALAIEQLGNGLSQTSSKLVFYAVFPLGIKDIQPAAAIKVSSSEELPTFTLSGHGLNSFVFEDQRHSPKLDIKVYDKDANKMYAFTLDPLTISADGSTLTFTLPRYVMQKETLISYADVKLHHAYVDVGFLGSYFDYFNTLKDVTLPITDEQQRRFRIYLSSNLIVEGVDKESYATRETLRLYGKGFHSKSSGYTNRVYFLDDNNHSVGVVVNEAWDDLINVTTPYSLDLERFSIGKSFVYVQLEDGSKSNPYPVTFVPTAPTASVVDETGNPSVLYKGQMVSLRQKDSIPIYYYMTGNTTIQRYVAPITINKSTMITAYAVYENASGEQYQSKYANFSYQTCTDEEIYIDYPHGAKCVPPMNIELIPRRFCPLNVFLYNGEFTADPLSLHPMIVECGYFITNLTGEYHSVYVKDPETGVYNKKMVTATKYWTSPAGRPMEVQYPGKLYIFNPDGSNVKEVGDRTD